MKKLKFLKIILFGLILIYFFACNSLIKSNEQVEEPINNLFNEVDLGSFGTDTKLFLNAQFSECGEWGGHKENMVIYAKEGKELYLSYQKFKVNCESIGALYGTPKFQKLEFERTLKLNDINKRSISDYIQRMVKSKMYEVHLGHSGNSFSVIKSDSTLLINVYDCKEYDLVSYNKLINELELLATNGKNKKND